MAELIHLRTAWDVDRHIVLDSADKLVLIRFSGYENPPRSALISSETQLLRQNEEPPHKRGKVEGEEEVGARAVAGAAAATSLLASVANSEGINKSKSGTSSGSSYKGNIGLEASTAVDRVEAIAGMAHYLATQQMDSMLVALAPKVRKYCVIYAVDTNEVPEFNQMYELGHSRDPFAVMFFYRGVHIRVDVGTGNNNKVNFFAFEDMEDFLPIVNAAFRAGKLGKNMASSDRKFSTAAVQR